MLLIEYLLSSERACNLLCHKLICQRNKRMSSLSSSCPSSSSSFLLPDNLCLKLNTIDESSIIDKKWNGMIIRIVNLRMATCEILAIFSTLGGAFSCLAESGDLSAAQTAGCIAFRQLILSRRIEDPNLIIRCYIYQVYSLCQQRLKKKAIKLLKQIVYPNLQMLVSQNKVEPCIKRMYIAACHKVQQIKASWGDTRNSYLIDCFCFNFLKVSTGCIVSVDRNDEMIHLVWFDAMSKFSTLPRSGGCRGSEGGKKRGIAKGRSIAKSPCVTDKREVKGTGRRRSLQKESELTKRDECIAHPPTPASILLQQFLSLWIACSFFFLSS